VKTDFEDYKAAVANIVPPQRAAPIAAAAGVADRTGWCPIEPAGFESTLQPGIHVLGDAALMGAMPKAAHAAAEQGKVCAAAIAAGRLSQTARWGSVCSATAVRFPRSGSRARWPQASRARARARPRGSSGCA